MSTNEHKNPYIIAALIDDAGTVQGKWESCNATSFSQGAEFFAEVLHRRGVTNLVGGDPIRIAVCLGSVRQEFIVSGRTVAVFQARKVKP